MINAPDAFKRYRQFILWQAVKRADGKTDKLPIDPRTLTVASAHDPGAWLDYETAAAMADTCNLGLAFVFTDNDPFWFLDIDSAWDGQQWSATATTICQWLGGCAQEISQSGCGLHVFGSGPLPMHGCKNNAAGLEIYHSGRFVALTGNGLSGSADHNPGAPVLDWLISTYFPITAADNEAVTVEWTTRPCSEWSGPTDDTELLALMFRGKSAANIFGNRATPQELFTRDEPALERSYPTVSGRYRFDHSSADAALCSHLAFWTGRDCARMERLFNGSGLVRDKWRNRADYRQRTILRAVSKCKEVYNDGGQKTIETVDNRELVGYQFCPITQQIDLFKGCVYIQDLHRAFCPDGSIIKPEQFKVKYGGTVFNIDTISEKTTKDAWEAFTQSRGYRFPKVTRACFRPELDPGTIVEEEGDTLVNTYVPAVIKRRNGDPSPALELMERMLPNERDRQILLAYSAACVQYPGRKFQWCPLIQGVQGNGKSFWAECIANSIGWKYTHTPRADDLANKFNYWILGKLFIIVEEVYVKDRQEVLESLKPLITATVIEIHGKGDNQKIGDNRANFWMCSNHKDALRITQNDRRYCIFFTAQQNKEDLVRFGMNGTYFPDLYDWLRYKGGKEIMADFLSTYEIPDEFNPAKNCHRAPTTSSTDEALLLSLGGLEQEITDAVEEERYGFAGGWISSKALDNLLRERRQEKSLSHTKRKEILVNMGYVIHPRLQGGRITVNVPRESGKPILYCRKDHPTVVLGGLSPNEIAQAYLKAQESSL